MNYKTIAFRVSFASLFFICQKNAFSGTAKIVLQNLKKLFCLALCGLLFSACSKDREQGAEGIQGLQGIKGETGPSGADGQDGEQGTTDTANVIYSDWITLDFGETPILETSAFDFILTDQFTQEIKDSGLVMVFGRKILGPVYTYYPLPYTRNLSQHFEFTLSENYEDLVIWVRSFDDTNIFLPYLMEFRYIIVPGGIPAGGKSAVDFTKMNYREITAHFGIEE